MLPFSMSLFDPSALPTLAADIFEASAAPCKAYPGSADWPSPESWNRLNDDLRGRLLQPAPPGAICHPGQPTYDAGKCPSIAAEWSTYEFHADDPVSVMWNKFSNDTCVPDPDYPCSPDGYPAYVVNATEPEHVKLAVDFAREHEVRLNLKNTGHDFSGRSNAPGSLSIWLHHLKWTQYHEGKFKLSGSGREISGNAMTVGGCTQVYEAYVEADKHGQVVVGGGAKSVGLVGHAASGGHSILSGKYGLAADQILQMEVVTADGKLLTANEDQHSDLFWALRGGGGSTFGVVTSMTTKTFRTPVVHHLPLVFHINPESPFFWEAVAYVHSRLPDLGDAGLSGYFFTIPSRDALPDDREVAGTTLNTGVNALSIVTDQDTSSVIEMVRGMDETMQQKWPNNTALMTVKQLRYETFLDWFSNMYDRGTAGHSAYLGSRLLGRDTLQLPSETLGPALKAAAAPMGTLQSYLVAGTGTAEAQSRGGGNSVHTQWRESYLHTWTSVAFMPFNKTSETEAVEKMNASWQPLRDLTPNGGSYISEGFKYEPNPQQTFWGDNYERLLKIKRKYDPADVFWCQPCVGNERWEDRGDGRLCRTGGI